MTQFRQNSSAQNSSVQQEETATSPWKKETLQIYQTIQSTILYILKDQIYVPIKPNRSFSHQSQHTNVSRTVSF